MLKKQVVNEIDIHIAIAAKLNLNHKIIVTLAKNRKFIILTMYIKIIRNLYKWVRPFLNRE